MRLSDAIALGRTLVVPRPGIRSSSEGEGCALGMADTALGRTGRPIESMPDFRWMISINSIVPCGCWDGSSLRSPVNQIIAHLFDKHVYGARNWTLDKLIDWVRSVEPNEPEECPERQASSVEAGRLSVELETK